MLAGVVWIIFTMGLTLKKISIKKYNMHSMGYFCSWFLILFKIKKINYHDFYASCSR